MQPKKKKGAKKVGKKKGKKTKKGSSSKGGGKADANAIGPPAQTFCEMMCDIENDYHIPMCPQASARPQERFPSGPPLEAKARWAHSEVVHVTTPTVTRKQICSTHDTLRPLAPFG